MINARVKDLSRTIEIIWDGKKEKVRLISFNQNNVDVSFIK